MFQARLFRNADVKANLGNDLAEIKELRGARHDTRAINNRGVRSD